MKSSARSGGMNLARPLKAGKDQRGASVASRRLNLELDSIVALRRAHAIELIPTLKRRAKFMPPLRVEEIVQKFLKFCVFGSAAT